MNTEYRLYIDLPNVCHHLLVHKHNLQKKSQKNPHHWYDWQSVKDTNIDKWSDINSEKLGYYIIAIITK